MPTDFTLYGDHPWVGFETNQRTYYVPELLRQFRARSVYNRLVGYKVDPSAQGTGVMVFTELLDTEPNWNPLTPQDIWLPSAYMDTRSIQITMEVHGDKVALRRYDQMVTYWLSNGRDLRYICRSALAQNMVDYLDILARNAFLAAPYVTYAGTATGRASIGANDLFDPDTAERVWVHLAERNVPMAVDPVTGDAAIIAVTSPRVIKDIRTQSTEWIDWMKYADPKIKLNAEVGMFAGTRFIYTTRNILHNYGAVIYQTQLTAATEEGVGAAQTVDSVYTVGQPSKQRYVQVADSSGFQVGDIVTIHDVGPSLTEADGTQEVRKIVALNSGGANRLTFDKPLLKPHASGAYVTKGRHLHATVFIGGPNGVVAGIADPPQVYNPPTIDDMMAIIRFSWGMYGKYQVFRPEVFELHLSAGTTD